MSHSYPCSANRATEAKRKTEIPLTLPSPVGRGLNHSAWLQSPLPLGEGKGEGCGKNRGTFSLRTAILRQSPRLAPTAKPTLHQRHRSRGSKFRTLFLAINLKTVDRQDAGPTGYKLFSSFVVSISALGVVLEAHFRSSAPYYREPL